MMWLSGTAAPCRPSKFPSHAWRRRHNCASLVFGRVVSPCRCSSALAELPQDKQRSGDSSWCGAGRLKPRPRATSPPSQPTQIDIAQQDFFALCSRVVHAKLARLDSTFAPWNSSKSPSKAPNGISTVSHWPTPRSRGTCAAIPSTHTRANSGGSESFSCHRWKTNTFACCANSHSFRVM